MLRRAVAAGFSLLDAVCVLLLLSLGGLSTAAIGVQAWREVADSEGREQAAWLADELLERRVSGVVPGVGRSHGRFIVSLCQLGVDGTACSESGASMLRIGWRLRGSGSTEEGAHVLPWPDQDPP
ncbi:hypothetical protein [uncultured Aquitalea sp.]|uniref:hypothetical protein n=1 Tax=uncultured Aquitalea sp. TaxID=540272 RepID=UPI0026004C49|nr:hypothetical protein [uncultured Aquitalea sp.]